VKGERSREAIVSAWLRRHRAAVGLTVVVIAALAAVGGAWWALRGGSQPAAGPTSPTAPPTAPPTNPLIGLPGVPVGPVLGVKIDNTTAARPQWGLNQADVVYVEQVEGGLTQLVAIYASRRPTRVGPVRSVRRSDPELLAPYGPMALAFSGGAANVLASFRVSTLVDASLAAHPQAYERVGSRPAPYNLVADAAELSRDVHMAARVRDVGFRWAATDTQLASATRVSRFTAVVGSTPVTFAWNDADGRWEETRGGSVVRDADGQPVSTSDVIVQFCRVTPDLGDIDQAGSPAAYTHTVGSGRAVLFRDGRRIDGTWRRARQHDPTRFLDAPGRDLMLRPGGVWVVLAPTGSALTAS
jgi:Protein of unknown function (DUF3048) N-terminal domain/Protein of unknown function (DUF3048) C-terminal domain